MIDPGQLTQIGRGQPRILGGETAKDPGSCDSWKHFYGAGHSVGLSCVFLFSSVILLMWDPSGSHFKHSSWSINSSIFFIIKNNFKSIVMVQACNSCTQGGGLK